jgi:methylenetetrahydrofolate reductase (NADPH)
MPHLTGIGHTRAEVRALLDDYEAVGVTEVLALAGDPRPGEETPGSGDFRYAMDLIGFIREETDMAVGVAAFPELHPRSPHRRSDRRHLADKLALADFGITQFFFDADHYRRMVDELGELGCDTPVLPGVITVTNPTSVKRFADMNGTTTPDDLWNRLEAAGPAERLRIACDQAAGLAAELLDLGAPGIHLYTLNVPEAAEGVLDRLGPAAFRGSPGERAA